MRKIRVLGAVSGAFVLMACAVMWAAPHAQVAAVQEPPAQTGPERPRITGISHLALRVSDMAAAKAFYGGILGLSVRPGPAFAIGARQHVMIEPGLHPQEIERLTHLAFPTSDVAAMA